MFTSHVMFNNVHTKWQVLHEHCWLVTAIALISQMIEHMKPEESKVSYIAREREEQWQGYVLAGIHIHSWKY